MSRSAEILSPSDAARQLGVSTKALRLYEERGLVSPIRSQAGWRAYRPEDLARAREVVALRALGFSLGQVERVLTSNPEGLAQALSAHEAALKAEMCQLSKRLERSRALQDQLAEGRLPPLSALARLTSPPSVPLATFALPWPWGGERFTLRALRPLTYIIGPLGSGKTRFARRLAEVLPEAGFLGLQRLQETGLALRQRIEADPAFATRVEALGAWLQEEGAAMNDALLTLIAALETADPKVLVIDMIEEGLDAATQQALIAHLRQRGLAERSLVLMTRSSAILDLEAVGPGETILLCPANHSPPTEVSPHPGSTGYEAVATCLATPAVRARTAGVVAWRPQEAEAPG